MIGPLQKQKPEEKEKRERLETFPLSFGVNTAAECTTRLGRPQHQMPIHSEPDRLVWVSFRTRSQFIFALIEPPNLEILW